MVKDLHVRYLLPHLHRPPPLPLAALTMYTILSYSFFLPQVPVAG